MNKQSKHENYEILNLIGYGLAKFDIKFVREFGYTKKSTFHNFIVQSGVANTVGTVKNRQDLFDHFFDNGRKGWWQKGNAYIHRKHSIDAFFGSLNASEYADIVKMHLHENYVVKNMVPSKTVSPVRKSQFKQLQQTGYGAEMFFMGNYQNVSFFSNGVLQDARMLGDGYDFQINVDDNFFLAEIKGVREKSGGIRMTKNEYDKAKEYKNRYALIVVSELYDSPKMNPILNPISTIDFTKKYITSKQINYHTKSLKWQEQEHE